MKIEYTPTHHRREHNASETTQASFLATFKVIRNKIGQKRYALYDILQNTYNKLKQLFSKI